MDIVFAKETTHATSPQGHTLLVIFGTHWPANDPMVKAHPSLFTSDPFCGLQASIPPVVSPPIGDKVKPIETATKEPGEVKVTRRAQ